MNKTIKLYGIIFLIVMFLLALMQLGKKDITDWRKNFDLGKKTPFGLYVFNNEAETLLGNKIKRINEIPYTYYEKSKEQKPQNILVVQTEFDESSWEKILKKVNEGSDAMVISTSFPKKLQDSLKFIIAVVNYEETNTLKLTDKKFEKDSLVLNKFPEDKGFYYLDKSHEILGKSDIYEEELQANFLKINLGKGHLYFHTDPTMLTNYYILKPENRKYIENVFSYLPNRETVWFVNSDEGTNADSPSPLSFILSKPALRYAWWLLLAGLLLFIIFQAKRKQRIVPIIEPLQNKSVEVVKSVGNLYLQEGDFHDMMAKKAQYFLNRVRTELLIDTQNLDENFAKKLQLKTGKSLEKINEAIVFIKKGLDPYASVMKDDLIKMNKLLNEILK